MNTFDEIIQTKAYNDLNVSELEIIQELVSSEEEYNEMKLFYSEIDQIALSNREEVSASVKTSLNSVFQAKHPGISQNWNAPAEVTEKKIIPLYNRTLFRVAALLVLSAGVTTVWFSLSEKQLAKSDQAKLTASSDSVPQETTKTEQKKKFPLNEGNENKFTAASGIPADENVEEKIPVYSNATTTGTYYSNLKDAFADKSVSDQRVSPSPSGTYKVTTLETNGTTYYLTSGSISANNNWSEPKSKEADKKGELTKAGLDADLNPGGFYAESVKDYKPSIKTSDYLTLIEPSF